MLKRTIIVLASLSMLVALLPGVALADGTADVDELQVTVTGTTDAVDVEVFVGGVSAGTATSTGGAVNKAFVALASGLYDGAGDASADFPQVGQVASLEITWTPTGYDEAIYHSSAALADGDADGTAVATAALPAVGSGSISGDAEQDTNQGVTDTLVDLFYDGTVWSGGVARITWTGNGAYHILTGSGAFMVSADVRTYGDFLGVLVDSDTVDDGEVQYFSKKATAAASNVVNVGIGVQVTGVDFLYENETAGVDDTNFDHADILSSPFSDMVGHWAQAPVETLLGLGLVAGCTTTTFCPESDITRAEFSAMLGRELTMNVIPVVLTPVFTDVPASHWASGWIKALKDAGIVKGDAAGAFNPEAKITRAEAVAMLARWAIVQGYVAAVVDGPDAGTDVTTNDLPAATLSFVDVPTTHWAAKEVSWLFINGIIKGNTDGTFGPMTNLGRAEMAALVDRSLP
jgi:hypothetical protein